MKENILKDKESIEAFKLFGLWRFLQLEVESGLNMSRHGSAYSQVKNLTGWKGSKKKILTILSQYLACIEVITFEQMKEVKNKVGRDYFYSINLKDYCEIV